LEIKLSREKRWRSSYSLISSPSLLIT
jgi:hypothetical protein